MELGIELNDVLEVVRQRDATTWPGREPTLVWYQGDTSDGRTINVLVEHRTPQYAPVVTVREYRPQTESAHGRI